MSPNNDLISRSALFKTWDALDETQDPNLLIDAMIKATQDAPAVDAEPVRHGRWSVGKSDFGWAEDIDCSECGSMYNFFKRPNYCPNCGAKMGGNEDAAD